MLRSPNHSLAMRYSAIAAVFFAVALQAAVPAVAQAKDAKPKPSNSLTGKIKTVEKKGRTLVLSIETENGETTEQILTTRTPVIIKGAGDSGFLRPGAVVYTKAFQNKAKKLYGKKFIVYLDGSRFRGAKPGKTPEILEVIGPIVQMNKEQITLNIGRSGPGIVQLEKGYKVNIESADRELIVAGATVELTGKPARGRFRATAVEVTLTDPLDSAKYFADRKDAPKRSRKRSRATRSASKPGKNSTQSDADSVANPFAEIEKKAKN
jgi:hypothetical protein